MGATLGFEEFALLAATTPDRLARPTGEFLGTPGTMRARSLLSKIPSH
jgi:hypothetical protein